MTLKQKIQKLQQRFDNSSNFLERSQIAGEIHELKMKLENITPQSSEIECVGCGS